MPQSWLAFAGCFALVFSSEVSFLLVLIYSQLELSFWKKKREKKNALLQWFLAVVSFYASFSHSVNILTFS